MADTRTDAEKVKEVVNYFDVLKKIRQPYEAQIDEVIKFVNHSRRKVTQRDDAKGGKTGVDVYDGTAISAANILRDGLCGNTATQSLRWFHSILPGKFNFPRTSMMRQWIGKRMDEYPRVREWLEDRDDVLYSAFLRSNFYDTNPEFINDGITIGTGTTWTEEDLEQDRIIFTVPHFREGYFSQNRYGVVDTMFRWYKLSLRDLVDKFGLVKMKEAYLTFQTMLEKNPYEEKEILHAVFPRKDLHPYRIDKKNMPFASFWIPLDKTTVLLLEDGYEESPFTTWRWRVNNDEICGRGPSWDSYVEIMKANSQGKTNLQAGQRAVEGPIVAPDGLRGKIHNEPRGVTFVQSMERDMPKPLTTNMQLPWAVDQQERTQKIIREYHHTDFFLMLYQAAFNKVELTATQTIGMQAEQAAVLGVRVGRLNSEGYRPQIKRVAAIEGRKGRLPEPPEELLELGITEDHIETDFAGPLAQAQKRLYKYQSIRAGLEFLANTSQILPEAMDRINPDRTVTEGLDAVGWPASCLNDEDTVKKIREARQAKRELQETIQATGEVAKAVQKTSREIEPGSGMDRILGGGEGA